MRKKVVMTLIVGAVLAGCAVAPAQTDEEQVGKLAQGWLNALLDKDLAAAYQYTTPGFKESVTLGQYHARVGGAAVWTKAEVTDVLCKMSEKCIVKALVTYKLTRFGVAENTRLSEYIWIKGDDGTWAMFNEL